MHDNHTVCPLGFLQCRNYNCFEFAIGSPLSNKNGFVCDDMLCYGNIEFVKGEGLQPLNGVAAFFLN